jgi:uncharacterized protein (DUF58 family)
VITWFVPRIRAGEFRRLGRSVTLPRRGVYTNESLSAVSGFPFGLAEGRLDFHIVDRLVVFPRLGRLHRGGLRRFLTYAASAVGAVRFRQLAPHPTAQGELHGVRPFRAGDSPRWVHWRTSARRSELMVREFERTPTDNLILILDPWTPARQEPEGGAASPTEDAAMRRLEDAVSVAATICWEWCRQKGDRLVFAIAGPSPRVLDGVTGRRHAASILESLAQETGSSLIDVNALVDALGSTELPAAPVMLVSTRAESFHSALCRRFHRPAAVMDVTDLAAYDFFENVTHAV